MAKKSMYPDTYGKPTSALPDVLGPLNVDNEGDELVPPNDMAEVAPDFCHGHPSPDPLSLISVIQGKGGK
jgi:hypothetical protein